MIKDRIFCPTSATNSGMGWISSLEVLSVLLDAVPFVILWGLFYYDPARLALLGLLAVFALVELS